MSIEEITQHERESGSEFLPRFDQSGLITAVVSDFDSGQPLMVAHMNEQALRLTLSSREAHFYSRSRAKIWHKGEVSGNVLTVQEIRIDCDQDAVWLSVIAQGHGAACHTGQKSCFFRKVIEKNGKINLEPSGDKPLFDPADVYKT